MAGDHRAVASEELGDLLLPESNGVLLQLNLNLSGVAFKNGNVVHGGFLAFE